MQTYHFKTNIHCDGCIAKITPFLEQVKGLEKWEVDLKSPDKTLTVQGQANTDINTLVTQKIKEAGYQIEPLN